MDLALTYNPSLQAFDLLVAGTDLAADRTLASAVLMSLLCDSMAEAYEVGAAQDRRGWWADAYTENNHRTGSRLWLLEREKQLASVVQRCKLYCEEALEWMVEDGLVSALTVTVFMARTSWLVAIIKLELNGLARNFRFEFDEASQVWRLAGEGF